MEDLIDGDTVFADILMMRQVDDKIVVLVEGQEDVRIIDAHINFDDCRSEIAHGKKNVLRVAELCNENGMAHVLCVVDRDFDSDDKILSRSVHISISENYDLLADVVVKCPDAVGRVITSHVDRAKYKAHTTKMRMEATDLAVDIAAHIGCLRYASIMDGHALQMKRFPVPGLIEAYEESQLVETVASVAKQKSTSCTLTVEEIAEILRRTLSNSGNLHLLCNSHDLANILAALIRDRWGGPSTAGAEVIVRALSGALDWECFQNLRVCDDLRGWSNELRGTVWRRDAASVGTAV